MMRHDAVETLPALSAALTDVGLSSLDDFLRFAAGERVSRLVKRPVRAFAIEVAGVPQTVFLKQYRITARGLLTDLWKRRVPLLAGTTRELGIIRLLESHQIPVMVPLAWGERRLFGIPVAGFLLVGGVVGDEFGDRYMAAAPRLRRRLRRLHGALVGTLHRAGIQTKVRPQDLIVISEDFSDFRRCLTVIDRERGMTQPVAITPRARARQLADIWSKSGIALGLGERRELLAFLAGYLRAFDAERVPGALTVLLAAVLSHAEVFLRNDPPNAAAFRAHWRRVE